MTDSVIRFRIDSRVKAEARQIFQDMGLTLSDAVRLFLYQSVAEKRIPFSINIPNATTRIALETAKDDKDLEKTDLSQLAKDWSDACVK